MMPVYSYHCKECGEDKDVFHLMREYGFFGPPTCSCEIPMQRRYDVPAIRKGFQGHYNQSVGKHVANAGELTSELSKLSDEQSERLGGMPVNYQPIDPHDAKSMVERKGVESRERKVRERQADARAKTRQEILSTLDSKGG